MLRFLRKERGNMLAFHATGMPGRRYITTGVAKAPLSIQYASTRISCCKHWTAYNIKMIFRCSQRDKRKLDSACQILNDSNILLTNSILALNSPKTVMRSFQNDKDKSHAQ